MARRKRAGQTTATGLGLPDELVRGQVHVEDFVPASEPVLIGDEPAEPWRRQLLALRRWQAAVTTWGAENGLDRKALYREGLWPIYPPRFREPRTSGGEHGAA